MPHVRVRDACPGSPAVDLAYETFGDPADPPLLMVAGLGACLKNWPERSLCEPIAKRGYFVITYDNRDSGRSSFFEDYGKPFLPGHLAAFVAGQAVSSVGVAAMGGLAARSLLSSRGARGAGALYGVLAAVAYAYGRNLTAALTTQRPPPYTLEEVAEDGVLLLDALGITKAHLLGASMGGMLAQLMVIGWEHRFLSFASIMSDTGRPSQRTSLATAAYLFIYRPLGAPRPAPGARGTTTMEEMVRYDAATKRFTMADPASRLNGGQTVEDFVRGIHEYRGTDRDHPAAKARQLTAIIAATASGGGARDAALARARVPSIVIHGIVDNLVPVVGGLDTAEALGPTTCRKTYFIPGMSHELPDRHAPRVVEALCENMTFAEGQRRAVEHRAAVLERGAALRPASCDGDLSGVHDGRREQGGQDSLRVGGSSVTAVPARGDERSAIETAVSEQPEERAEVVLVGASKL